MLTVRKMRTITFFSKLWHHCSDIEEGWEWVSCHITGKEKIEKNVFVGLNWLQLLPFPSNCFVEHTNSISMFLFLHFNSRQVSKTFKFNSLHFQAYSTFKTSHADVDLVTKGNAIIPRIIPFVHARKARSITYPYRDILHG